jgi:CheY-like chemotaxis protein
MSSETTAGPPTQRPDSLAKAASELNNLLQIISGTSLLIEDTWGGSAGAEKYLAMLRSSIERAEKVAAELVKQAGGPDERMLMHPDLAAFAKTKSAPPSSTPPSSATPQSVLVVDDEKMALTLVKRILSEAGYRVATAQSGFECLDLFRLNPRAYDLVLLDLAMPFMDGEETLRRLREIRSDVPVVLCAGFIEQEKLDRLMAAGLAGFLRKPLAPDEIVSHVRSTLQSLKYSRDNAVSGNISAAG